MRFKTRLLGVVILVFSGGSSASGSDFSFNCEFNRHYASYLKTDKTEKYQKGTTYLSVFSSQTAQSTLILDGSVRATNSKEWKLVSSNNLGASYVGSSGDLLTIIQMQQGVKGQFQAALQWTSLGYAFSSIGICDVLP